MTEPKKEFISFESITDKIKNSPQILQELNTFDKFVIITRGGLVVAGMLSQYLNSRYYDTLCIKSYSDDHKQKQLKVIKSNPTQDKVLIIDDIVDSGKSIELAKEIYPNSKIFALHYKPDNSSIKPDYFFWKTDKWIVYPWEIQ